MVSEYGDLLHLRPYARARTHKTGKVDLREVKIIGDNTDAKSLLKQLNANPSAHFLFDPAKGHYANARTLYLALKRLLEERHYGHLDKKQTEKLVEQYGEESEEEGDDEPAEDDPNWSEAKAKRERRKREQKQRTDAKR